MCRDIVYRLYHRVFMITRARSNNFFFSLLFFGKLSYDNGIKQNKKIKKVFNVIHHMFAYRRLFFPQRFVCVRALLLLSGFVWNYLFNFYFK